MKMSKVAKMVGVDRRTIYNWVQHPSLHHLFSKAAINEGDRELDERDIFVINTIAYLREHKVTEWGEIAKRIEDGYVVTGLPVSAAEVDTGRTPLQQYTYSAETKMQLDAANKRIIQLEDMILELKVEHRDELEAERQERSEEKEKLLREMGEREGKLLREIGQLEMKIQMLQKQLDESQGES